MRARITLLATVMIKPDNRTESIINAFTLEESERLAAEERKSGKHGLRVPKEFRREFASGYSPVAARWRKNERAVDKQVRQKAKHAALPSSKLKKAIAAARAMPREGATIKEIAWRIGLYYRTVLEHTKQDKP